MNGEQFHWFAGQSPAGGSDAIPGWQAGMAGPSPAETATGVAPPLEPLPKPMPLMVAPERHSLKNCGQGASETSHSAPCP